jgi:hypothetical protein
MPRPDTNDQTTPLSGPTRRTVVRSAAWSIPVIAAAIAAPREGASTPAFICPDISDSSLWTVASLVSGALGNGSNRWNTTLTPGVHLFQSEADNHVQGWGAPYAPPRTATTFEAVAGATYTFVFTVRAGYGNNQMSRSRPQRVSVLVGGQTLWTGNTRASVPEFPGGAQLPIANNVTTVTAQTYSVNFTAPTSGPTVFQYQFVVPGAAISANPAGANDDIWISIPTTACTV